MQAEDEVSAFDRAAQDVRGNCPPAEHPISALRFGGRYGPLILFDILDQMVLVDPCTFILVALE
jgi:hypothetical protein